MGRRAEFLWAGVFAAVLVVVFSLTLIMQAGCHPRKQPTFDTWLAVQAGEYAVPYNGGVLVVQIKINLDDDRFYWRVMRMVTPPPTPRPEPKITTTKKGMTLDVNKALEANVPWRPPDDQVSSPHAFWTHQCCDCASVHRVLSVPTKEGLLMLWWKDELQTRKERIKLGIPSHDPWPESLDPSIR